MNKIVLSALLMANLTACMGQVTIKKKMLPHLCIVNDTDDNVTVHGNGKQQIIDHGQLQSITLTKGTIAQIKDKSIRIFDTFNKKRNIMVQTIKVSELFKK